MSKKQSYLRFECIPQANILKIYGEYSDFIISQKKIDAYVEGEPIKLNSDKVIKLNDIVYGETSYCPVEYVSYELDSIFFNVEGAKPLPVRVVIDVPSNQDELVIDVEDLLKKQIDIKTEKFSILEIVDSNGGEAKLEENKVIFTRDNNKSLMTFSFQFENEFGSSPSQLVPVLLRTPDLPKDSKFYQQWHLDYINVWKVWPEYTGKNISIVVCDTGFLPGHIDIDNNIASRNNGIHNSYTSADLRLNQHALQVAGIIAAERNDKYYVGIAYESKIHSYQIVGLTQETEISLEYFKDYDVINNSWGSSYPFSYHSIDAEMVKDFKKATSEGRNKKGSIIVFASGNSGGIGLSSSYFSESNNPYVIVVGGINKPDNLLFMENKQRYFASPGANILVSAPASNIPALHAESFTMNNSYKLEFNSANRYVPGTSFSAPMVSGVAALLLEANPSLGYRDVQEIFVSSAKLERSGLLPQFAWSYNKASCWNGGGYHFSNQYGFGNIDAYSAVMLAKSWPLQQTAHNQKLINGHFLEDLFSKNFTSYKINISRDVIVEQVSASMGISISGNIQDVGIYLVSPLNTVSPVLMNVFWNPVLNKKLSYDEVRDNMGVNYRLQPMFKWEFLSNNFWGESSKGEWRLGIVVDNSSLLKGGSETKNEQETKIIISSPELKIFGKAEDAYKQMIYTDEFISTIKELKKLAENTEMLKSEIGNRLKIVASQKIDIINMAALSKPIIMDFMQKKLFIANEEIDISGASKLKKIIATSEGDYITISSNQNLEIKLGSGKDILEFGGSNNNIHIIKDKGVLEVSYFSNFFDRNIYLNFDEHSVKQICLGDFSSNILSID